MHNINHQKTFSTSRNSLLLIYKFMNMSNIILITPIFPHLFSDKMPLQSPYQIVNQHYPISLPKPP